MIALTLAAAALWLAVWLGRTRAEGGVDLRLYARLLAGQRLVFAAALFATLVAATFGVLSLARAPDRDLVRMRDPQCMDEHERMECWYLDDRNEWQLGTRP